jgi:hypothetical protein
MSFFKIIPKEPRTFEFVGPIFRTRFSVEFGKSMSRSFFSIIMGFLSDSKP